MSHREPLFDDAIPVGNTVYIPVPIVDGQVSLHLAWPDADASADVVLQVSNMPNHLTPYSDTTREAERWPDSGITVDPPTGAGAGATAVQSSAMRYRRARLKVTATDAGGGLATNLRVWSGV